MDTPEDKKARLAQALRDNLKRRKAQARAATPQDEAPVVSADGAASPPQP